MDDISDISIPTWCKLPIYWKLYNYFFQKQSDVDGPCKWWKYQIMGAETLGGWLLSLPGENLPIMVAPKKNRAPILNVPHTTQPFPILPCSSTVPGLGGTMSQQFRSLGSACDEFQGSHLIFHPSGGWTLVYHPVLERQCLGYRACFRGGIGCLT